MHESSTVPSGDRQRLFLAIWPDADLVTRLHELASRALTPGQGRVIEARNLHLTLAFLGTIDQTRRACVESGAGERRPSALTLTIDCLGFWPRSHILWAGCSRTPELLRAWVDHLRGVVTQCGLIADTRPYRTHVTLARHVRRYSGIGRGGKVAARMRRERVDGIDPLEWPVRALTLVASETRQHGARYTILREWPLS
ncbi:MAG: 2'-5' RNA ligase [Candidatus Muproteobacteria bacterium RBG_16_62_13]|uniref:RNA 2',3'-cyclic phosphodiesterase n=1 Tax=Candidatus Muproteobacteria bacterium RBG_16_62_13 TaxID=1817756 RepID=A0A1F6T8V3_9PROT|nr:MAG: 2'-5' RNA ligase [Candidatus Muproteobacteria bacterium RBG_16_62_13]